MFRLRSSRTLTDRVFRLFAAIALLALAAPSLAQQTPVQDLDAEDSRIDSEDYEMNMPKKIQFQFLLFPNDVKTDSERSLAICFVNVGLENSLLESADDHVQLSIPVGSQAGDLADGVGPPGNWASGCWATRCW